MRVPRSPADLGRERAAELGHHAVARAKPMRPSPPASIAAAGGGERDLGAGDLQRLRSGGAARSAHRRGRARDDQRPLTGRALSSMRRMR
jgi:hypothetical protein